MYACQVRHDRDRLLLRPSFGTLSGFWLLLAVPVSGMLLGVSIWLREDASRVELPAFALPLMLGFGIAAIVSLLLAVGKSPLPLVLDRVKGLQLGGRTLQASEITSLRIEAEEPGELDEQYHLWLYLENGERHELKRSLWLLESNHTRICRIGHEIAEFLGVPLIDSSFRQTQVPYDTLDLRSHTATRGQQA